MVANCLGFLSQNGRIWNQKWCCWPSNTFIPISGLWAAFACRIKTSFSAKLFSSRWPFRELLIMCHRKLHLKKLRRTGQVFDDKFFTVVRDALAGSQPVQTWTDMFTFGFLTSFQRFKIVFIPSTATLNIYDKINIYNLEKQTRVLEEKNIRAHGLIRKTSQGKDDVAV